MVSRKEVVDISGQGLCGGWKARDSRKRSRRSPEALTAGGPTLRSWHDLLNVRPKRGELTIRCGLPASSTKPTNHGVYCLVTWGHSGPRIVLPRLHPESRPIRSTGERTAAQARL